MFTDGLLATAGVDPLCMTIFWFEFTGALFFILGWLMRELERRDAPLTTAIGWQILALALVGVVLVPQSGIWFLIPQGVLVLNRASPRRRPPGD